MSFNNSSKNKVTNSAFASTTPKQDLQSQHDDARGPLPILSGESALITYNHITYLLYVISYFTAGLLWIVPIVMNYVKRRDADGSWLATHFDWQIKTFWYSIVFFILGAALSIFSLGGLGVSIFAESGHIAAGSFGLFTIGLIIIGLTIVWHLYRIVRGWIALADKRPVP